MELRTITFDNMDELIALTVREDQKEFVARNIDSFADAYVAVSNGFWARAFGLYEGDEPVGFVMFGYDSLDDPDEPAVARKNYCLWRFMIDQKHQGKGLGRQAMLACLDYLRTEPCGPAEQVWLSYEPENLVAKDLYHKFGFHENGQLCGQEVVAARSLLSKGAAVSRFE